MPPKHPHHHRHGRDTRIDAFVDRGRIARILTRYVTDATDREFVLRCLLDEGPAHHRGSNWILLALLGAVEGADAGPAAGAKATQVPLRVPPHLEEERDDATFPLPIPLAPLERLAPGDDKAQRAMLECLTDGPPQHSLANAAMLCLLDAILRGQAE